MRTTRIIAVVAVVIAITAPAEAHPHIGGDTLEPQARLETLTARLANRINLWEQSPDLPALHLRPDNVTVTKRRNTTPRAVTIRPGVEQWRPLVEKYFPAEHVTWAMRVMQCESGGNPSAKNPNSSASGLFQHLARYWDGRAEAAGWAGASIWDPEANIAVSAWLLATGGKSHWVCK